MDAMVCPVVNWIGESITRPDSSAGFDATPALERLQVYAGLAFLEERRTEDPWDVHIDTLRARATPEVLAPHHRTVLTLRYLDDLPVNEVADILERTVHATEALLVRARSAFRRAYSEQEDVADA